MVNKVGCIDTLHKEDSFKGWVTMSPALCYLRYSSHNGQGQAQPISISTVQHQKPCLIWTTALHESCANILYPSVHTAILWFKKVSHLKLPETNQVWYLHKNLSKLLISEITTQSWFLVDAVLISEGFSWSSST